ncbi:MAG: ribonucleotide-diphosphate reductase subunit beta, partial [Betaproteobacteria bacterium HGW-Betaproteobacteria-2]
MLTFEDEVLDEATVEHQPEQNRVPSTTSATTTRPDTTPSSTSGRVNVSDKRAINGQTDVNQLVPFKYHWAWDKYLAGCANHWMPQEISMSRDIAQWKDSTALSPDERLIVKRNL